MHLTIRICKKKLASKLGKDVILTFIVQIIIMIAAFSINKILSNRLNINDFGLYNIIKRSSAVISFIMLAGTGIALPRYLSIYLEMKQYYKAKNFIISTISFITIISLITSTLILIFQNKIGNIITGNTNIRLLELTLLFSLSMTMASFLCAYYRGIGNFKKFNLLQVVNQLLLILPISIIPIITISNIYNSWTIIYFIMFIICSFYEIKKYKYIIFKNFQIKKIIKESAILYKYSFSRLLGDFFLFSLAAFPIIYLSHCLNMESVAFFSVGITLTSFTSPLFSFIGMILLPYVAACITRKEGKRANNLINKLLLAYIIISLFITFIFSIFMPNLISIFFSKAYYPSIIISKYIILSILPQAIYLLLRNPIDAISVFPYNTIILAISFTLMVMLFLNGHTINYFAFAYSVTSYSQGILSLSVWYFLKKHIK